MESFMQKINSEERGGWIASTVLFLMSAALILAESPRSVYPSYQNGSLNWLAGNTLHSGDGVGGFVYLPQAAVLFIPFALLPRTLAEILWRFFMIGIFGAGIHGLPWDLPEALRWQLQPKRALPASAAPSSCDFQR